MSYIFSSKEKKQGEQMDIQQRNQQNYNRMMQQPV